jgi:hypothetical protein
VSARRAKTKLVCRLMMESDEIKLVRVSATYFSCGVLIDSHGVVKEAAPILKWATGKHFSVIQTFLERKKALLSIDIIEKQ